MSGHQIELKIYTGSITRGLDESGSEFRRLYEAIDAAAANGAAVTVTRYGKTFRLVLEEQQGCPPCQEGRHEDCVLVWTNDPMRDSCGCDQRTLHARILADRVALYRAARKVR